MAQLTGPQIGQLQELILDAFGQEQFEELLLVKLDVRLDQIVPAGLDWRTSAREAIIAAEREGWTANLLHAVAEARPRRKDIQDLIAQLLPLAEHAAPTMVPVDRPAPALPPFVPQPTATATSKMWRWLLPLAALLALGVVLGFLLRGGRETPVTPTVATTTGVPVVVLSDTSTPEPANTPTPTPTDTPIPIELEPPSSDFAPPSADIAGFEPDSETWLDVPAGEFLMGSAEGDALAGPGEKPQHTVYLDTFSIMQTEVTNAMYAKCVEAGECVAPSRSASRTRSSYYGDPQFANYPVIYVSWEDARKYCAWVGGRLPTEAQWEKAARGTDGRIYPWGDEPPNAQLGNFDSNVGDTTLVGAYSTGVSPYGALDLAGNVWEWTADWYDQGYYSTRPAQNPTGPDVGQYRVRRGGSWSNPARHVRTASRLRLSPDLRFDDIGFRCVGSP